MTEGKQHLKKYLTGALKELNRLSDQIRDTRDYSEHAEAILCLREMVLEQMEGALLENPASASHQIR